MPIDLVGKLHRTLFIEGVDARFHEDLAQMLLNKCGPVEEWDSTTQRLTIAFTKMDSMPNGLAFNGTCFGGTMKKMIVWAGNKGPPAGYEQLSLSGPAGGSTSAATSGGSEENAAAAAAKKRRMEFLANLSGSRDETAQGCSGKQDGMTAAEKRYRILSMTSRQLKALVTLTECGIASLAERMASAQAQLEAMETLGQRLVDSAAAQKATEAQFLQTLDQEVLVGAAERRRRKRSVGPSA